MRVLPICPNFRLSNSLSGGESQRINLATSLGSSLVGSLYILDEPSIGLHSRDTDRLIKVDDTFYDGQAEATNAMPIFRYAEILLIYAEAKAELGEFTSDTWNKTIKLLRERAGVNGKEHETADSYIY